ncbi:hypothetical protein [Oerskovia paurometabola]|uniref:hypothetical protein n=1 Tax=Oerskovia paurometabola TaxID=162170 RepID=UPI00341C432B
MILHAMLEQTPADSTGEGERVTRETRIEAATYEKARAQLFSDVPEGWRVLWLRSA